MAAATWGAPSAQGANILGAVVDTLANGLTSAFVTYDNSTAKDLYALVEIALGSITPATGGSITLRQFATANGGASVPDNTASVGGGEATVIPLTVAAGTKLVIVKVQLIGPFSLRFAITNNTGVALAATGNTMKVQPFGEAIA